MTKSLYIFFIYASLFYAVKGSSQPATIDSIQYLLREAKDTTRVNLLNQLSASYWYIDPQKTIQYAMQAVDLGEKLGFKDGTTAGYNNTGVGYYQ